RAQDHDFVRQPRAGGVAERREVPVHGGFAAVDVQLLEGDGLQSGQNGGEQVQGHVLALGAVGEDTEVAVPVALRGDLDLGRLEGAGHRRTRGHWRDSLGQRWTSSGVKLRKSWTVVFCWCQRARAVRRVSAVVGPVGISAAIRAASRWAAVASSAASTVSVCAAERSSFASRRIRYSVATPGGGSR